MPEDMFNIGAPRSGRRLEGRPPRGRKKTASGSGRQRTLSLEDVRRVVERGVQEVEGADASMKADSIITYLNSICVTLRSAEPVTDAEFFDDLVKRIARYTRSDYQCIRTAAICALRLACHTEEHFFSLILCFADLLLARSLELNAENFEERVEALKLSERMLQLYGRSSIKAPGEENPNGVTIFHFPKSVFQPITVIAMTIFSSSNKPDGSTVSRADPLALPCFAILCEVAVLLPDLVIEVAGTGWIVESLAGVGIGNKRLSAVVCRVLHLWLNSPRLRVKAKLNSVLEQIFAPLIEIGFFQNAVIRDAKQLSMQSQINDVLDTCAHTFVCILRSWPGLFACAASDETSARAFVASPMRLLEFLGVGTVTHPNLRRIRDVVVDVCCEVVDRPYASKTFESWYDAMQFYSSLHHPDAFKCSLRDDFVLAEHEVHMAHSEEFSNYVDLLASFRALAVYFLVSAGLVQSFARLILSDPDNSMGLKATLLLNDLLLMSAAYLPTEWRLRVLSVPTLVQCACETLTSARALSAMNGLTSDEHQFEGFTFMNAGSATVLLNRLDLLNSIALMRRTQPSPISNIELFVQSESPRRLRSNSLSKYRVAKKDSQSEVDSGIHELVADAFDTDLRPRWTTVDGALQLLELDDSAALFRHKHCDRCYYLFSQLMHYFSCMSGQFVFHFDGDRFPVAVFSRTLRVFIPLAAIEPHFEEVLHGFVAECAELLLPKNLYAGLFAPRAILNTGATTYYFAFIGAISSQKFGRELLEKTKILQSFVDILTTSASLEYVKLIVSCLDYSADDFLTRIVLQTALTSTSEPARKWSTRFLGVLAAQEVHGFSDWGMTLLLGQLADRSPKVVRHTVRLLHQWIPHYPECVPMIRNLRLDVLGDAGVLLKCHMFADESFVKANIAETRAALDFWKQEFNVRYVDIIDEEMKIGLLNVKRSLDGRFARVSTDRYEKFGVPLPIHLYGRLAMHPSGQQLLMEAEEVERLLGVLRGAAVDDEPAEERAIQAALFAVAHIAGSPDAGAQQLLPTEAVPLICRFAESCPVLTIRGVAFWALNVVGNSEHGARTLASLGWESNRFTHVIDEQRKSDSRPPRVEESRLWVRCLDEETDECIQRADDADELKCGAASCKTDSAAGTGGASPCASPLSTNDFERNDPQESSVRSGRAFTVDSSATSGFGSTPRDNDFDDCSVHLCECDSEALHPNRKFSSRRAISAEFYKGREYHFSSAMRQRFKLVPFAFSKFQVTPRAVGMAVRYVYMSDGELRSCREFRRLFPRYGVGLIAQPNESSTGGLCSDVTAIVLPAQPNIVCNNIFSRDMEALRLNMLLSAKFDKVDPNKLTGIRVHSPLRCFYCNWNEECYGRKVEVCPDETFERLREKLLSLVERLESKYAPSEKKLISLYEEAPRLFALPCLYADVLETMLDHRFRLETRRLLHELFTCALFTISCNR